MAESTQCMTQRLTLHDEICERVAGLAPAPVALRILEVLRNERAPVQSLADVITTDPLLAARVLKLANSGRRPAAKTNHCVPRHNRDGFGCDKVSRPGVNHLPFAVCPRKNGWSRSR